MKNIPFPRVLLVLFSLLNIQVDITAQTNQSTIESTISQFFDGFSEKSIEKLKLHSTTDFLLLENGEVWNMDTIAKKFARNSKVDVKRVNSFEFIKVENHGSSAWVSYFNTAIFTFEDKSQTVKWLESTVLVRESKSWKIRMLHSTKIK